ncbi:MAG: MerR family DNA-binding protein [bacterium]
MALTTGDVADEAGVDYQTVLYYEREGLIEKPPRLDNGYRQYPQNTVRTIQFIQRAKDLGFTLEETRKLLEIRDGSNADCDEVESFARDKRRDLQTRIEKLQKMESVLSDLIEECADGEYEYCPILETLTEDETNGSTD